MGLLDTLTYVLTIKKAPVGNPSRPYVNRYDVRRPLASSVTYSALNAFMDLMVIAEQNLHTNKVQFQSATLSTYAEEQAGSADSVSAFITRNYDYIGSRTSVNDVLPLQVIWYMPFTTIVGRSGAKIYRGCLFESDVTANEALVGRFSSSAAVALDTLKDDLWVDFQTALSALATGSTFEIVSHRHDGVQEVRRQVSGLGLGRPGIRSYDHQYYDQA